MISLSSRNLSGKRFQITLVVAICLLALWLRQAGLMKLPLFWIEGANLVRTHNALAGELFTGNLNVRKWLYPVFLMIVNPSGPEGPWLARTLSGLVGVLSVAATIRLGRDLGDWRTGLMAGLFYAVMPLAVFHERQILSDPLLALFTTWATVLMIWLARRPRWWIGILLGVLLGAAFLTKISAVLYLVWPFAAIWLLGKKSSARPRALLWTVIALMIVGLAVGRVYQESVKERSLDEGWADVLLSSFVELLPDANGSPGASSGDGKLLVQIKRDTPIFLDLLWRYTGIVSMLLVAAAPVLVLQGKEWRKILFLIFPGFIFGIAPVIADRPDWYLPARYVTTLASPLAVLVGLSLRNVASYVGRWSKEKSSYAGLVLWLAILAQGAWFDIALIIDPARAPLTRIDAYQYVSGAPSGYGYVEIADLLLARWRATPGRRLNVLMTQPWEAVAAYLGPRVGDFNYVRPGDQQQREAITRWAANGEAIYFVESQPTNPLPFKLYGAQMEYTGGFESSLGPSAVYEVTAFSGQLVPDIYAYTTPPPEKLIDDYAAIATRLTAATSTFIFPENHADMFYESTGVPVIPLSIHEWPMTPELAGKIAEEVGRSGDAVQIVIVDEAASDSQRMLTSALVHRLYYLSDDWSGLLHRWVLASGPPDPSAEIVDATFEDAITLKGAAVLDSQITAGDIVRFVLEWTTSVPVRDSFKIFVHIVGGDGQVLAQHDGVPGAGLLPMTIWQPGEMVGDRFAIVLPIEAVPGKYEVRVGIYHPDSGLRLRVTAAEVHGPDYVIIGQLEVK